METNEMSLFEQRDYFIEQATVQIGCCSTHSPRPFSTLDKFATGIYIGRNGNKYLVTNWHVVTGKSPETQQLLPGVISRPEHLIINEWVTRREFTIPLYTHDNQPRWIEKPETIIFEGIAHRVDVVAIPIETPLEPIQIDDNLSPSYQRLEPNQELIVLGYPYLRLRGIWKTAHIAESVQPYQEYFLINGRTKSGMSGSGVFTTATRNLRGQILVGIYSGRYDDRGISETLNDLDIGIVWKLGHLDRLIPRQR